MIRERVKFINHFPFISLNIFNINLFQYTLGFTVISGVHVICQYLLLTRFSRPTFICVCTLLGYVFSPYGIQLTWQLIDGN